jgi:predicted MFS family arabinose efflux permease
MAAIGISVALSFAAALVLGPVLGGLIGVSGIFWLTSGFALLGIWLLARVVPDPVRSATHGDAQPVLDQLGGVLADRTLLRLDAGIFLLHLTMVSLFVVLPLTLADAGLPPARHWQVYLPVVLAAIALMVPFVIVAERAGRVRSVLIGSAGALALALFGFALMPADVWVLIALLTVMFTVFNLLEAVLPSLVSKASGAGAKGTAMGVFASSQFIGAFLGGLFGGLAHEHFGPAAVYFVGGGAAVTWLAVATTLHPPGRLATHLLPVGELPAAALVGLRERLLAVPGVEEAVVAPEEGVAHLQVDNRRVDWARLKAAAAGA